ncbi:hypothetical protein BpHYR1_014298 [Brachionus plicatilis]|uniref:Uncharacterized protein n=1 Tax=Brachionus plicatilis TaxID=10195 RepID=A0A3M7R5Q0_BRAPC|nr:hypothetical protein BpHYR1_014298 [Brachionus plicatilis]
MPILKQFNVSFRDSELFLASLKCLTAKQANQQLIKFKNIDIEEFVDDGRFLNILKFGKQISSLYDFYPELETEAKIYVESETKKKKFQLFQTL